MILLYVLSIIAFCSAQDAAKLVKIDDAELSDEAKAQKQQENVESLMRQVGDMGMLIENYRRVILGGITEANDVCRFIEKLSDSEDVDDKIPDGNLIFTLFVINYTMFNEILSITVEKPANGDDMGIKVYRNFFQNLDDPIIKSQLFSTFENHIDNCFAGSPTQRVSKRDKNQVQKIRFHSWGGKRSRLGAPKVVIRTPFHSWGGKRSGNDV